MQSRCLFFLMVLIFAVSAAVAQPIHGHVVSAGGQPVAYATIRLVHSGLGTAANAGGEFVLKGAVSPDTLEVSCVGYRLKLVLLASVMGQPDAVIVLASSDQALQEVSVAYRDPMKIISKAISRIPENYISSPHVIRGFYRQTTMKGKMPLQLSEAVFDIYNYGYGDSRQDLFRLIRSRDDKNERDFHGIEFGQSPGSIFNDDIVKQLQKNGILGKEGLRRHHYTVDGITDYHGRPAYAISFEERPREDEHTFRGRILIDTASYAFVLFDFGLSPGALKNFRFGSMSQRMMMKLMGLELIVRADHDQISYQRVKGKWVFAGDKGSYVVYVRCPRLHYDFPAAIRFNYVVTETDTTQTAPFTESLRSSEHINDHDTNEGEDYWKDYNIMLPDSNTEALIGQIRAINQTMRLKGRFDSLMRKLPKDPALRLDSLFSFYHANGQFNGTALVTNHGKTILAKNYGWANGETHTPADLHTTYRIGSLSKSFTSVIINQLMAEGKIDVHAPVRTYLPWYVHGDVTIGQLLTHRSGIPEYFNNDDYKQQLLTKSFTLREVVERFCSDTLESGSGSGFSYSNSNFTILALIAQEVTGIDFGQLLKERIFIPCDMTDAFFGVISSSGGHRAVGYVDGDREMHYDPANTAGAGGISASASDLLKFHEALRDNKLLSRSAMDTMYRPRVEFKDYNAWYDYGWMTDKDYFSISKRHPVIYHPGTDLGFFTMFIRVPDIDECIILLNNTGDFPRYDLGEIILGLYGG